MNTSDAPSIRGLLLSALVLIALITTVACLAPHFVYGSDMLARPIFPFVAVMISAGFVYLFAIRQLRFTPDTKQVFLCIVIVGVILRAILFFSRPILEDDYYRYLWDGGITANGINPYAYTPNDIVWSEDDGVPESALRLAEEAGQVADRVNHPSLGTVYPPVAQGAFALAHMIKPWSLSSWKFVLLLCDIAVFVILLKILALSNLPRTHALIYWWNPMLLKETYNSGHMEMVILPFLMLGVYFLIQGKVYRSGVSLALAVATKLWPVIIIPILLRANPACWKRSLIALALAGSVLIALLSPMLWAIPLGDRSGFLAYGERWEMNDALFMVIGWCVRVIASPLNLFEAQLESITRFSVGGMLLVLLGLLVRKPCTEAPDFFNRLVLIVGALFMLSPTQFPWYFLWLLPFLALSPRPSLLLLTVMLPMYYLKFYFAATENIDFFHNTLVWVEYAPVLLYSAYELYRYKLAPVPMEITSRA